MASLEERQKMHQNVLRHFVETGRAPLYTEWAETLGGEPNTARELLRETTVESPFSFAWLTPDTDFVGSWAPFSNLPSSRLSKADRERLRREERRVWKRSLGSARRGLELTPAPP